MARRDAGLHVGWAGRQRQRRLRDVAFGPRLELGATDGAAPGPVQPALQPLTDIYAVPAWIPFANVFSVGDVLIAVGIVIAIVGVMRRQPMPTSPSALEAAAG